MFQWYSKIKTAHWQVHPEGKSSKKNEEKLTKGNILYKIFFNPYT
jgi:hypothetical protein